MSRRPGKSLGTSEKEWDTPERSSLYGAQLICYIIDHDRKVILHNFSSIHLDNVTLNDYEGESVHHDGYEASPMVKNMDDDLQFLVHFFNDKEYLFKTITMAGISQVDEICNKISSEKGWFWPRFAKSERHDYLRRRLFVEKALYEDYTQEYGSLKEKIPVFFYLYPKITKQKAIELGQQRMRQGETEPHILMVKIQDIKEIKNMTFTLNDSHAAYWKRLMESGIPFRGDRIVPVVLPDHNKVFPFSMIEQIHQKYKAQPISYEIQVWDYQLLETMSYTILSEEEMTTQPDTG